MNKNIVRNLQREVYCSLVVEGTHHWQDCPHDEVSYLKDIHRHLFHIKAYKIVTHGDRETEFILLKHQIQEFLKVNYLKHQTNIVTKNYNLHMFGKMSCEMLAEILIEEFDLSSCEVNEDNENGSIVTVTSRMELPVPGKEVECPICGDLNNKQGCKTC